MLRTREKLFQLSTVFVCTLILTVGMQAALVPSAYSAELTAQEKALNIFDDVIGLDMAAYRTNLDSYTQDLYFETLPQENVKYILQSDESELEVICTFADEKLCSMSAYVLDGLPHMTQPATNTLEMA